MLLKFVSDFWFVGSIYFVYLPLIFVKKGVWQWYGLVHSGHSGVIKNTELEDKINSCKHKSICKLMSKNGSFSECSVEENFYFFGFILETSCDTELKFGKWFGSHVIVLLSFITSFQNWRVA